MRARSRVTNALRLLALALLSGWLGGEVPSAQATPDAALQVQPIAGWILREAGERRCGPGVPNGNPVFTARLDVATPAGPGVKVDARGITFMCCEGIYASKRFPVAPHLSTNAALSFYYSAQLTLGGIYGDVLVKFTFLNAGQPIAVRRMAAVQPGPVHEPIDEMIPNNQVVTLALEPILGQTVFDGIEVSLEQYGCIFTSTQTISDITLLGTPVGPGRHGGLGQAVASTPINSLLGFELPPLPTGQANDTVCQATLRPGVNVQKPAQDTGDPVDPATGEVSLRRVDLRVPGRGIDWEFSRRYRSRINFPGPLGANWEFNYHARLLLDPANGHLALVDGNAREDVYARQGDGSYRSPTGFYTRLKVLQGDPLHPEAGPLRVEIANRHGMRTEFASVAGGGNTLPISRLSDRNGNALRFFYELASMPLSLTRVLDTYGRAFLYFYNTQGRICRVVDYLGREIVLTYDANGDLVEVRSPLVTGTPNGNDFPTGKREQYAYASGRAEAGLNHNLLSITAPNEARLDGYG